MNSNRLEVENADLPEPTREQAALDVIHQIELAQYTKRAYIGVSLTGGICQMARTNIEIDDGLVEKAMRLTGASTKREVVDIALRRLVEKGSLYRALRRLQGKLAWEGDVAAWRSARTTRR